MFFNILIFQMSDSEEDYMSEKILMECAYKEVRPGLLFKESQKRSLQIHKKQQLLSKKPKIAEQERRAEGLNTALPSHNKGFKILEKMGYTPGEGLGKLAIGIKEPVAISIKSNSSGLGHDQHIADLKKTKISAKETYTKLQEKMFLATRTEKMLAVTLRNDIIKAQKICEDLDIKQGMEYFEHPQFWQKCTIIALEKKSKKKLTDAAESEESESSSSDIEVENEQDKEVLLTEIITYLRTEYRFCMYCGDYIENEPDCPGFFRIDHD